jgi:hypothetical protein
MSNAATPTSINQGLRPTCNVATVECRTYTQNPPEAARLMTEVTTNGAYTSRNGETITVNAGSLESGDQAQTHPPIDGQREHASQIFQVTAVNVQYQRNGGDIRMNKKNRKATGTMANASWIILKILPKNRSPAGLKNGFMDVKDSHYHAPGLSDEQIVDVGSQINGDTANNWYIRYVKKAKAVAS